MSLARPRRARTEVGEHRSVASRLDSPLKIGIISAIIAAIFAVARFAVAAHGNIGAFIVLGSQHVDTTQLPKGVPVRSAAGYDGQFYYRLALDPLQWSRRAYGIKLDSFGRLQRIGYPFFAWLMAGGQSAAVPVTLVVVNVTAIGALAGVCGALAREAKRHALWGLLIAAYWGFLWTISRDLTELVAIVFSLAGLLALRRLRPLVAGGMLSIAVLSRETALMIVGAIFLARLWDVLHARPSDRRFAAAVTRSSGSTPARPSDSRLVSTYDLSWTTPVVVFLGWQLAVLARTHHIPVRASGGANIGAPFVGLTHGFEHYVPRLPSTASLLWVGELAILLVIGVFAAYSLSCTTTLLHERVAWFGYLVLSVSLASGIWDGDVGFRSLDEFYALSCVLLLFSRVRLELAGLLAAAAWVTVAVELVRFV